MDSLSLGQARRLAIVAQGLGRDRKPGQRDRRHLRKMLTQTGLIQIDSVNVLMRAQYLPGWSRLGAYPRDVLDDMTYKHRELFEYWGHEASLLPVALHPLLRWRMERARTKHETWGGVARLAKERPGYIAAVLEEVGARGPITAGELEKDAPREVTNWGWNWSSSKIALEYLFWTGQVMAAARRGFERLYDVTERVLPESVLSLPTPTEEEAHRELLLIAARCHGVGTAKDLADYFRINVPLARQRVAELAEDGRLTEVSVEGWRQPAYVLPGTTIPRRLTGRALLAPFDPLVWERDRVERLFGFRYRIEIYVPADKRVHGYYVLPFLLGERLVARVDLKSDRAEGVLRVQAAYAEPGIATADVAGELSGELHALSEWLGLRGVAWTGRGDLAI